jgi:SAM-dependent methyltransferase
LALIITCGPPYHSVMSTDHSYESTARYYDGAYGAVPTLGPDAAFYKSMALECGGPVLELGCGTGRVLLPIATQGIACAGVDASPAMLEEFRCKPGAWAVTLACARMESFDLPGRNFRLIYSAFRAFQHLDTVEQQLACLARVRAHLAPGGRLAFDVFNPRLDILARETDPEEIDLTFQVDGREVKRFATVRRDRVRQVIDVTMRYVEERAAGATLETTVAFTMRWFWRYELEHLLHRAGFADVEIYGDFDRSPVGPGSPAFVVVAR